MSQTSLLPVANAVRALAMDSVQKANSGHPGAPMGMADIATQLWLNIMNYNPTNPDFQNRDRFLISNGHASTLLYSILHLVGYDVTIDDLKQFRTLHSKTPGHPEFGDTVGVEASSGPLGQSLAMSVGFALAEKMHAAKYNKENFPIVDHKTFVFTGDGCLMEGLSQEAISLAGTFELGKLILLYDNNDISIDGNISNWLKDDIPARFEASGWHVIKNVDGHDEIAVKNALEAAVKNADEDGTKPTLVVFKTIIGYGSPNKAGSQSCHGAPLGDEEIKLTKQTLGIDYPAFEVPQEIYNLSDRKAKGQALENEWNKLFAAYEAQYPELAQEFKRRVMQREYALDPAKLEEAFFNALEIKDDATATRVSSQQVLNALAPIMPELFGGSADLSHSVNTWNSKSTSVNGSNLPLDFTANYAHYGVREFGMACIMNALALYGGYMPYGGIFLVFSDYMRSAIRMSALMKRRVAYVLSHDSIGVGEDGPTHQPIEQISSLRLIPGLDVWRPADTHETAIAWLSAVQADKPTALLFSRQNLPQLTKNIAREDIKKGGYIYCENDPQPEIILIATGSELSLAVEVYNKLIAESKKVRVVSMPCTQLFDAQTSEYKEKVLPNACRNRVALEMAQSDFWYKYAGLDGIVIGIDQFGASSPAPKLFELFGFTTEAVLAKVKAKFC